MFSCEIDVPALEKECAVSEEGSMRPFPEGCVEVSRFRRLGALSLGGSVVSSLRLTASAAVCDSPGLRPSY